MLRLAFSTAALRRRFMESFDLQKWTRIGAMNHTKTSHPIPRLRDHPLPIRWGEGRVSGRFMGRASD